MHEHVLLCNESRFTTSVSLMTSVLLFSFNDYSLLITHSPQSGFPFRTTKTVFSTICSSYAIQPKISKKNIYPTNGRDINIIREPSKLIGTMTVVMTWDHPWKDVVQNEKTTHGPMVVGFLNSICGAASRGLTVQPLDTVMTGPPGGAPPKSGFQKNWQIKRREKHRKFEISFVFSQVFGCLIFCNVGLWSSSSSWVCWDCCFFCLDVQHFFNTNYHESCSSRIKSHGFYMSAKKRTTI